VAAAEVAATAEATVAVMVVEVLPAVVGLLDRATARPS
jgi:hypothetical protein